MMRLVWIPITFSFFSLTACSDTSSAPPPVTAKKQELASVSSKGKLSANDPLNALLGSDEENKAGEIRGQLVGQLNNEVAYLNSQLDEVKRTCFQFQKEINALQTKLIMDLNTKTLAGGATSGIGNAIGGGIVASVNGSNSSAVGNAVGTFGTEISKNLGEGLGGDINKKEIGEGVGVISSVIGNNMSDCLATSKNLMTKIVQKNSQINEMIALGTE
jgi:hypothetical protein